MKKRIKKFCPIKCKIKTIQCRLWKLDFEKQKQFVLKVLPSSQNGVRCPEDNECDNMNHRHFQSFGSTFWFMWRSLTSLTSACDSEWPASECSPHTLVSPDQRPGTWDTWHLHVCWHWCHVCVSSHCQCITSISPARRINIMRSLSYPRNQINTSQCISIVLMLIFY